MIFFKLIINNEELRDFENEQEVIELLRYYVSDLWENIKIIKYKKQRDYGIYIDMPQEEYNVVDFYDKYSEIKKAI